MRERIAELRMRFEGLLLWRVWERMLEIEFLDRSVALAGKAFVSFFPLVFVVALRARPHPGVDLHHCYRPVRAGRSDAHDNSRGVRIIG